MQAIHAIVRNVRWPLQWRVLQRGEVAHFWDSVPGNHWWGPTAADAVCARVRVDYTEYRQGKRPTTQRSCPHCRQWVATRWPQRLPPR